MHKTQAQEIYKKIQIRLLDKNFLQAMKLTKKKMVSFLDKEVWLAGIRGISLDEDISCGAILGLCRHTMAHLSSNGSEPEEGWLSYAYRYLIKRIYPHRTDIVEAHEEGFALLFYLSVLRIFLEAEREVLPFEKTRDFAFADAMELENSDFQEQYQDFLAAFQDEYIYELMRIGREIKPFQLLSHVAGVHDTAMFVGRQLAKAGVPVDLALLSGAAAGHDIGKIGCMDSEVNRLPYLHYYYTDIWFQKHKLNDIGHIAANHSTWDLELENLPVESLLLIYADFRVKSTGFKDGKEVMGFFTLADAFRIILNKLDSVDEAKEHRYRHVYSRLVDFEQYMVSLGVQVAMDDTDASAFQPKEATILDINETVDVFKNTAIDHNIRLMHKLSREVTFAEILETARSAINWKDTRSYLNIFSEYYTYMTSKQKLMTLGFLYELMVHREGDIRRQAGELLGEIIANYDTAYGKELPKDVHIALDETNSFAVWEKYLEMILTPDHRMTNRHRRWLGYTLKRVVTALIENAKEDREACYIGPLVAYYRQRDWNAETVFILIDVLPSIPQEYLEEESRLVLLRFMEHYKAHASLEIRGAILLNLLDMRAEWKEDKLLRQEVLNLAASVPLDENPALEFLLYRIGESYDAPKLYNTVSPQRIFEDEDVISDIFLENLKAATPWKIKIIHILLLEERILRKNPMPILHVATHLSNLLKVSEQVTVRHFAGEGLVKIAPALTLDQRNEVVIELTKGLEIGEYEFSKYIPQYLGRFALYLHPKELDEFVLDLQRLQNSTNDRISSVALDTFGVMVHHYKAYPKRFSEEESHHEARRKKILGMLLSGLASYQANVSHEGFWVIGHELFQSKHLTLTEKKDIYGFISKKLLLLVETEEASQLTFFNHTANWNAIYSFLSQYLFYHTSFDFLEPQKVAFFPGTFDPFSLGHKEIARAIRDKGFVVYLALDEFSWSKRTQPHKIRRKIVNISVANEENIYLFPEDIPVNIANPADLKNLRELFPEKDIYMVAGSDVIKNASSYEKKESYSIATLPHIIFLRETGEESDTFSEETARKRIENDVVLLKLPTHFEDISSTKIRENIDQNRDISNLIDPVAQNYIYEKGLYLREPQYKKLLETKIVEIKHYASREEIADQKHAFTKDAESIYLQAMAHPENQMTVLFDQDGTERIDGILLYRHLTTTDLFGEFQDMTTTGFIRENTSGKIVLFLASFLREESKIADLAQLLLTEALANCLQKDVTYAIFSPSEEEVDPEVLEALERQGFLLLDTKRLQREVYVVDMKKPITLSHNVQTAIKEPLNENEQVLKVLKQAHIRFQKALTKLFPRELVISFDAGIMNKQLTDLITEANQVAKVQTPVRKLGASMAVPYGKIMKGVVIPNTVTKVLHTEKTFDREIKTFKIKESPQYLPLECQVRTMKSFRRPVILVDDLLHKGYRIQELDPIFKEEGLEISRIIVGVLSGQGKDLMEIQKRQAESVYFLPSLRAWFVETSMYPFIGGDSVRSKEQEGAERLINSINLMLPYVMPGFIGGASKEAVYDLSMVCLENTRDILQTLEKEYQKQFERSLTLGRLREVIIAPRCPDTGDCLEYDTRLATSVYIENDIERLIRLQHLVK